MAAQTIPGPKGHFITGSLGDMRRDFLQFLMTTAADYGRVARFRAGPASMMLVSDPDDIADILVKRADAFHKTGSTKRLLKTLLGDGLISLEGAEHRRHRRLMQPSFHTRQVYSYTEVVMAHARTWLDQRIDGEVFDIVPLMADLTLNIVVDTFFSTQLAETEQIRRALSQFSNALNLRIRSPIPLPGWLPTEGNRIQREALTTLDGAVYALIAARRKDPNPPADLLTGLLMTQDDETGQALTDKEIRDEIATIFFAGYETTTTTMAWVLYLLAVHPDVRERLRDEIMQVTDGEPPDAGHLHRLIYLNQVIKEVLRLYPPAWLFDREPVEDTTIGGFAVPKGQTIFISPYLIHRNPTHFESPEDFQPERFTGGFEKSLPRFAYFPFGGGPRTCIGQTFAQHTLSLLTVALVSQVQFELMPDQSVRPSASATLVPANGIQMRVHRL